MSTRSQADSRVRKLAQAGVLCGIALALSLVDSAISSLIPILPGFKLGLANIVSLYALRVLGLSYTLIICLVRSLVTALLSGNMTMLLFSLAGGIVSILIMFLLLHFASVIKASVTGGIAHNCMQVLTAVLVTGTPQVVLYLPVLIIAGALSGFAMGVLCTLLLRRFGGGMHASPVKRNLS